MFKLALAAVALLPCLAHAQQYGLTNEAARPIELNEAVRLAQINSPQAVQAGGALRVARLQSRAATLAFVPNINVSASSAWQRGQRIGQTGSLIDFTGPSKSYNDAISLNMELFDGGRRFYDIAAARASMESADAAEINSRYSIATQVKQQYFNVLAARDAEAAAVSQLAEAEQQRNAAVTRVVAGAAVRSDSLRATVQIGNAQLALMSARNDLANANSALTRLTGSGVMVTAGSAPVDEAVPDVSPQVLLEVVSNGPALAEARSQVRAAGATVKSARSAYLPTLNATYGRNGSGFDSRFGFREPFAYSSSFRLSVSLPVFNGLQREETLLRSYTAEDQAVANLRDTELRVRQELTAALGALRVAQQRIVVQEASVRASEEDLSIQQQRYEFGASLLLDVLQSQTQLNAARANLIDARLAYRMARATLEQLLGRDLSTL